MFSKIFLTKAETTNKWDYIIEHRLADMISNEGVVFICMKHVENGWAPHKQND
jgi:hypothetical protein